MKKFLTKDVIERTKIEVVCDNEFVTLTIKVHQSDLEKILKSCIPGEVDEAHEYLDKLNIPQKS
jgi:hypothetical protein